MQTFRRIFFLIEVADFHKTYRDTVAVSGLSFRVGPGEILGLVGPNGAGKTTTLRAVAGIIPPTQGRLIVAGHDVVDRSGGSQAARWPTCPTIPSCSSRSRSGSTWSSWPPRTGWAISRPRPRSCSRQFELVEKRNAPAQELSRGMRQKVAIACAYLHDPEAILFDEPLTGLDPAGIRTAKESIVRRAGGRCGRGDQFASAGAGRGRLHAPVDSESRQAAVFRAVLTRPARLSPIPAPGPRWKRFFSAQSNLSTEPSPSPPAPLPKIEGEFNDRTP